jgi:hypothetical protein
MGKRTWSCVACRKSYQRKLSLKSVECPTCHRPCESAPSWTRTPSPKRTTEWDAFWSEHMAKKAAEEEVRQVAQKMAALQPQPKASHSRPRVSYITGICAPLVKTLQHTAGLPAHQLAGHAANVDFWVGETKHCLAVIDGYQKRFERLRAGQADYEKKQNMIGKTSRIQRGAKHAGRLECRRLVCQAIARFLTRCHREGLLGEKDLNTALRSLGL